MEPNQVGISSSIITPPPPQSKNKKMWIITIVIIFIGLGVTGFYLWGKSNLYKNNSPVISLVGESSSTIYLNDIFTDPGAKATDIEDGDITSKVQVSGLVDTEKLGLYVITYTVTDSSSAIVTTTRTVNVVYKKLKIENIDSNFQISKFPNNTYFTLASVDKIDILEPPKCSGDLLPEVREIIRVSGGCWDQSAFDPDIEYSLVGINIRVINNSIATIQGDLIKLGFLKEFQSEKVLRLAQRDIDFSSYAIAPNQERTIQLSFWVPTEQSEVYLLYGYTTGTVTPPPFNQAAMKSFDGAIKIDFTSLKVISSKTP